MHNTSGAYPRTVLIIVLAICLSGCVTSAPYQTDASHPIKTLVISKDVSMPQQMVFSGFSQGMAGVFFGAVGALASSFREHLDIKLPETLRADLASELAKNPKFKLVASGPADAEVRIRVREYGFVQAGPMARRVKPILTTETQMVRPDGVMVWKSGVSINQHTDGMPERLAEEVTGDLRVAREMMHTTSRMWAVKTAESLR